MKNKNIMMVLAVFFDLLLSFIVMGFEGSAVNNVALCVMICSLIMTGVLKKYFLKLKNTIFYTPISSLMFGSFLFIMIFAIYLGRLGFVALEIFLFFIAMVFFFLPVISFKEILKNAFNDYDPAKALFGISEHFEKVLGFSKGIFVFFANHDFGLVLSAVEKVINRVIKNGQ
ncbi:hypothetical protein QIW31_06965 [Francisellaceae bacterium CB299]